MEIIPNLDDGETGARPANEDVTDESSAAEEAIPLIGVQTLRRHRQLVYLSEWIAGQAPWRRRFQRAVRDRMRAA